MTGKRGSALGEGQAGTRAYLPVTVGDLEYVPMTWGGLLAILDEVYPSDIFTGESGDPGPRMVTLARRVDALEFALADVLAKFHEKGHPGLPCTRSSWVADQVVERWHAVLNEPHGKGLTVSAAVCQWCGRAIALGSRIDGHSWYAVKGAERGYDPWLCDARDDGYSHHAPSAEESVP